MINYITIDFSRFGKLWHVPAPAWCSAVSPGSSWPPLPPPAAPSGCSDHPPAAAGACSVPVSAAFPPEALPARTQSGERDVRTHLQESHDSTVPHMYLHILQLWLHGWAVLRCFDGLPFDFTQQAVDVIQLHLKRKHNRLHHANTLIVTKNEHYSQ